MKKLIRSIVNWAYGFEVDTLLNYDIGTIAKYNLKKVPELPENPEEGTIYMIIKTDKS